MNLVKGQTYKWSAILAVTGAANVAPFYVLRRAGGQSVVAACLVIGVNPRAPYEIIPANTPLISGWADVFSAQREPVPVFVKELDNKWYYRGQFRVRGESTDSKEIKLRGKQANRTHLYKILFLEEVVA